MTPAQWRRFESCLALAKQGATAGERAAGLAAAERVAASAGLSLAEAKAHVRGIGPGQAGLRKPTGASSYPWPTYSWTIRPRAKPKRPPKPPTVEELRRQKAETEAWRKRQAAAADRKLRMELAEQAVDEAQQRAHQAERDREWALRRAQPEP